MPSLVEKASGSISDYGMQLEGCDKIPEPLDSRSGVLGTVMTRIGKLIFILKFFVAG
jgi:hypothetical protein